MPTTVTDPYTELANIVEQVILTEFSDDPYLIVKHDRIHEAVSVDGRTWVGISPEDQVPENVELSINLLIQFYGAFEKMVNPEQEVDPRVITTKAERLRVALQKERTVGTSGVWFFDITRITFPKDATGNKSRFEAQVRAYGNNMGLIETIG